MPAFDLQRSLERAKDRFGPKRKRQVRGDRGRPRLAPELHAEIQRELGVQERPAIPELMKRLDAFARVRGLRPPSRATLYQLMSTLPSGSYAIADLPIGVRNTLYNLGETGQVPGHQLAFHCFNYGTLEALSFAAGLPWLALFQAARMRGWRARSRGLLTAVLAVRGI